MEDSKSDKGIIIIALFTILAGILALLTMHLFSSSIQKNSYQSNVKPTPTAITSSPPLTTTPLPTNYTRQVVLQGVGRPDDMVIDTQGHILFSDFYNGTVSRLNADGSVTVILRGLAGPEGLVVLSNGTLIIAQQRANNILSLSPDSNHPIILRTLPGTNSSANCKQGVDGIAFDSTTNTLIIPDSPIGNVYRMSLDGKTFTLLTSNIVRPVGAAVDAQGTVYIADECGGALFQVTTSGSSTRIGGFGMPDDIVLDHEGNILVTDLQPSIHALVRLYPATNKREVLARTGFIEPQGLVVDANDNIYVSDDYADIIVKYKPG